METQVKGDRKDGVVLTTSREQIRENRCGTESQNDRDPEAMLDDSTGKLLQGQGNVHEGHERVRSESSDSDRKIVR